eukprot:5621244-Amphidinium_carterae.1
MASVVLPKLELGVSRVRRVHSDRASEFLSRTAAKWAKEHNVLWTKTGGHSFPSNGRAEVGIRHLKTVARRALLSSKLDVQYWGYCAKHVAETLRAFRLRKAGDKSYPQPESFGSFVAVRIPGNSKAFRPFQPRGRLGRLLYHDLSERKCFILDSKGTIWYGFAAVSVGKHEDGTEEVPQEILDEGWHKVILASGLEGWYNEELGLFRMRPPTIAIGTEISRIDEPLIAQHAMISACATDCGDSLSPDVGSPSEYECPDVAITECKPHVHVAQGSSSSVSFHSNCVRKCCSSTHVAQSPSDDHESYCCFCGGLVNAESGFQCWLGECTCWVHLRCCVLYPEDGGTVIGCPCHPRRLLERLSCANASTSESERDLQVLVASNTGGSCTTGQPSQLKRVTFASPEVELKIEFEVESIVRKTRESARYYRSDRSGSSYFGSKATLVSAAAAEIPPAVNPNSSKTLARKKREQQALDRLPEVIDLARAKPTMVTVQAIKSATGDERSLWKKALQAEMSSLEAH